MDEFVRFAPPAWRAPALQDFGPAAGWRGTQFWEGCGPKPQWTAKAAFTPMILRPVVMSSPGIAYQLDVDKRGSFGAQFSGERQTPFCRSLLFVMTPVLVVCFVAPGPVPKIEYVRILEAAERRVRAVSRSIHGGQRSALICLT